MLAVLGAASRSPAGIITVWDGLRQIDDGVAANTMSVAVRDPGRAGGAARRALFLHPQNRQPATMTFTPQLPATGAGDRLILAAWPGLSDGVKLEDTEHVLDGVGIGVEVEGTRLFRVLVQKPSWAAACVDLAAWSGKKVKLVLFTDDGGQGNTNYDWALIGEPQIVWLRGNALTPDGRAQVLAGGLLVELAAPTSGATVRLTPTAGDGKPLAAAVTHALPADCSLWYTGFDVSAVTGAQGILVQLDGAKAKELRACSHAPGVVVKSFGPDCGVLVAGQSFAWRAVLSNPGRAPVTAEHGLTAQVAGLAEPVQELARLNPGAEAMLTWRAATPAQPGTTRASLSVEWRPAADAARESLTVATETHVWPSVPASLPAFSPKPEARLVEGTPVLASPELCVVFLEGGAGPICWYVQKHGTPVLAATSPSLVELCIDETAVALSPPKAEVSGTDRLRFGFSAAGVPGRVESTCAFGPEPGLIRIETSLHADQDLGFRALRGPAVLAGDGAGGKRQRLALFPGLEYLKDAEPSSSTRDFAPPLALRLVPDPYKVTVPVMAVETSDALVAVLWDQARKWHAERFTLSALFASPNFHDGQANHKMQLFVPSDLDLVPENQTLATKPYTLRAGDSVRFDQSVWVRPGATVLDAVELWCRLTPGGVPLPEAHPRPFVDEVALCRHGFLQSVWDAKANKSQHVVGWANANAPQFAALLLVDALVTGSAEARERAELIARTTLAENGEKGLASGACCHILRGNLPFLYGHLDGAWMAWRDGAYQAMGGMEPDGSWRYHPDAERASLGEAGAAELGLCAGPAAQIWRWARASGDAEAIAAGRKALEFMDRFVVPAGAQGWECPIHEPDILASAYAIRAYVDAFETTGEKVYLERAVYWARTGLPFCYLWNDPAKPGMRYATIPVFGSTFFTHSWLALPVQWCGLVYAYGLIQLARHDTSRPWLRIAEGITVSGMYQQCTDQDPKLEGTYPDSWGKRFTVRNPVFINPEDIILPLFALRGHDIEPQTTAVEVAGTRFRLTSTAKVAVRESAAGKVSLDLTWLAGGTTCSVVPSVSAPARVTIDGRPARLGPDLDAADVDACYDAAQAALFLKLTHGQAPVRVEIDGLKPGQPPAPPLKDKWTFGAGPDGWEASHACQVTAEGGTLLVTTTGMDPYFSAANASFPAQSHARVVARARLSQGQALGLFWGTDRAPGTAEARHLNVNLPADGQWHDVVFDLRTHPGWTGTVNLLRLDLEPADVPAGTRLEVESVEAR